MTTLGECRRPSPAATSPPRASCRSCTPRARASRSGPQFMGTMPWRTCADPVAARASCAHLAWGTSSQTLVSQSPARVNRLSSTCRLRVSSSRPCRRSGPGGPSRAPCGTSRSSPWAPLACSGSRAGRRSCSASSGTGRGASPCGSRSGSASNRAKARASTRRSTRCTSWLTRQRMSTVPLSSRATSMQPWSPMSRTPRPGRPSSGWRSCCCCCCCGSRAPTGPRPSPTAS
mmetsp:Transcript_51344/g.146596  ORF Transcript_51344/g.146596 Transcript_51344/m.146596 type:complete len:231 (-) Transcript_51344:267-959(-)